MYQIWLKSVNPFPNKAWFYPSAIEVFWKTLKDFRSKCQVTNKHTCVITDDVLGSRKFNHSQPFPKRQIFDSSKLNVFADNNFQFFLKWQKVLKTGRKHCGKGRNCSLRAISPVPIVFSKDFYCRQVKPGLVWEMVNRFALQMGKNLPVFTISSVNSGPLSLASSTMTFRNKTSCRDLARSTSATPLFLRSVFPFMAWIQSMYSGIVSRSKLIRVRIAPVIASSSNTSLKSSSWFGPVIKCSIVPIETFAGYNSNEKKWRPLTHYQTTNFRLFQTERLCRRQFQIWWK